VPGFESRRHPVCARKFAANVSRHLAYLKNSGVVLDRRDGYRVFYRLTNSRESNRRLLFNFLRQIFKDEDQLEQDTKRLKEAITNGSCTISEWKPYSAIEKSRIHRTGV
jgi:hypothetical protein